MDRHQDLVLCEAKCPRRCGVVDLGDRLNLEVVIAGAQSAHLTALAFLGALRDPLRPGPNHRATFLNAFKIARFAPTLFDGPSGAARQHGIHFNCIEGYGARAA